MMAQTAMLDDDSDNVQTSIQIQEEAQKRKKYIYGGAAALLTLILIIVIIAATASGSSSSSSSSSSNTWPVVIATWNRLEPADIAYEYMQGLDTEYTSLDAVVKGVQFCQTNCNLNKETGVRNAFVDSEGNVTQSAMVIFGPTMDSGSVANLYDIDDAVGVAKHVLIYTDHAMIVGEAATRFAVQNGFQRKDLSNNSRAAEHYESWLNSNCSANFWRNVKNGNGCQLIDGLYDKDEESNINDITGCDANETSSTGPNVEGISNLESVSEGGMVTGSIAIIGIDETGAMSLATSSNGLNHKIAGRVSDAAIIGAGGYIDPSIGGCTATGDGDVIIRFTPSKTAVTLMKTGMSPQEAAQFAVDEIESWCGDKQVIVLCLSKDGTPGIAANANTGKPNYAYRSDKCDAAVSANVDAPRGDCV